MVQGGGQCSQWVLGVKGVLDERTQWVNGRAKGAGFNGVELQTKTRLSSTTTTSPSFIVHSESQENVPEPTRPYRVDTGEHSGIT